MDQLRVDDPETDSEPDTQPYFYSHHSQTQTQAQVQSQTHQHANATHETLQQSDSDYDLLRRDPPDMTYFGEANASSKTPFVLGGHGEAPRWAPSTSTLSLSDSLSDALSESFIEAQKRLSTTSSQQWGSSATGLSLSDSNASIEGFDLEEAERRLSYMSVQRWEPNASNLSLTDVLMDTDAAKVDEVGRRLSNIAMQDLTHDPRRTSQLRADENRRGSDLWKKYPLPGTGTGTETGMDSNGQKDTGLWKQLTGTYTQAYYICELAQMDKFSGRYQRNNRNGGLKNIRCFPCCGSEHFARGFCGESVTLLLLTNQPAEDVIAVAEFGLALEAQETKMKVGDAIPRTELQRKVKTNSSESLFNPWWLGEVTDSRIISMTGQRALAFEFNASKRGWNYGWVANKHNNQLKHCLRSYLFVPSPQDENQLICVGIAKSPDFLLYTRKSKLPASTPAEKDPTGSTSGLHAHAGEDDAAACKEGPRPLLDLLEAMRIFRLLDALNKLPSEVLNEEFSNLVKPPREKDEVKTRFEDFARYCVGQNESISGSIISVMENLCKLPDQGLSKQEVMIRFLSSLQLLLEDSLKTFGLTFATLADSKVGVDLSLPLSAHERFAYLALAEQFMHHQFGYDAEWLQDGYISRVKPVAKYVQQLQGHWVRSNASLFHHERMLSIMGVPVSLRMCWVYTLRSMTIKHCGDSETLIVGFRNKLLNTGVVRLMYDKNPHPWTQISPLGVDPMFAGQSYLAWYDVDTHTFNIQQTFQRHKILWSWKSFANESLQGKCVLLENVLVNKDSTWTTVCEFADVLQRYS